jgi:hypothetical protein
MKVSLEKKPLPKKHCFLLAQVFFCKKKSVMENKFAIIEHEIEGIKAKIGIV